MRRHCASSSSVIGIAKHSLLLPRPNCMVTLLLIAQFFPYKLFLAKYPRFLLAFIFVFCYVFLPGLG